MTALEKKLESISWGGHQLDFSGPTLIMGILNVTPDSFSDGGRFHAFGSAIAQAEKLVSEGADILDIGGESTRPFSDAVSEKEELARVLPVIEKLASRISIPISIDTNKSGVAQRALDAGASILNDVGALRMDPELAGVAAKRNVPVILMHMKGKPKDMQMSPSYDDLLGEIKDFLKERIAYAVSQGISRSKIIVDPGIGFGKTVAHNLSIINNLHVLRELGAPILIGPSRKAFIRNIYKDHFGSEFSPDHPFVENGTQVTITASILNGAQIVRVHDVANTLLTVRIADAIRKSPSI